MNFQQVQQANGQNVTMFGAITEFKGEGINPNSGKPFKKVTIVDANNEKHTVTLRGTLPDLSIQGQRTQFDISTYSGNYQGQPYTGYSGFWKSTAQVNQQPQPTAPQQAQQGPSQPAQKPNDTQKVDWDAKDLRNARMNSLNNATLFITKLAEVTQNATWLSREQISKVANSFVDYIYNGLMPTEKYTQKPQTEVENVKANSSDALQLDIKNPITGVTNPQDIRGMEEEQVPFN